MDLRVKAASTHAVIWAPIQTYVEAQVGVAVPAQPVSLTDLNGYRRAGDALIAFAFAYVITEDIRYLNLVIKYTLSYLNWTEWAGDGAGVHGLGHAHLLQGCCLAYDWTAEDMPQSIRWQIRDGLSTKAALLYTDSIDTGIWWARSYNQNHNWIKHSAVGLAALVLEGEVDAAADWIVSATENMTRVQFLLNGITDGSWHEGLGYQNYGLALSLTFLRGLYQLKGVDLLPHTYKVAYPLWRVYNYLYGASETALVYSDQDAGWDNGYEPRHLLRHCAKEHQDGLAEWMAQQIDAAVPRQAQVSTVPWYVLEFLTYDPTVVAEAPTDLPLDKVLEDLSGVIWRSGWGGDDLVFSLKSGYYGGRNALEKYLAGSYPFDQAGGKQFNVDHGHGDLNTFSLYKGSVGLTSETTGDGLKASSYHNTVLVNGAGQYLDVGSVFTGGQVQGVDGSLTAEGAGDFQYLISEVSNRYRTSNAGIPNTAKLLNEFTRRVLFYKPNYLILVDRLKALTDENGDPISTPFTWICHFGQSVTIEGSWLKGDADGTNLLGVNVLGPNGAVLANQSDGEDLDDGQPYATVTAEGTDIHIAAVLYPTTSAAWGSKPSMELIEDTDEGVGFTVGDTDIHLISFSSFAIGLGGWAFNGECASIIKDGAGNIEKIFLQKGKSLALLGQVLVQGNSITVEITFSGTSLALVGENLGNSVVICAPNVNPGEVTINGSPAQASKLGNYITVVPGV